MTANVDAMVREGINAFRTGKKEDARALLMRAVEIDQYNEQAWLWLSAAVDSPDDQRTCLENVLAINPNNERARQGLQSLTQHSSGGMPPPPTPVAPGQETQGLMWDMPATETSSATAWRPVDEPSSDEYDDWVNQLNLPTTPAAAANPFTVDYGSDNDAEDDNLADGPFQAPGADAPRSTQTAPAAAKPSAAPARTDTLFDDEDDDFTDLKGGLFIADDDDFSDDDLEEINAEDFFQYIPAEIKPTRLPGTIERYPLLVTLGLVVVVLLNVGAGAWLVLRLTGAA